MSALVAPPTAGPSDYLGRAADFVRPDFHQVNLDIEGYLKEERNLKLDTDTQICRLSLLPPGCPLGPTMCPYRHTEPAPGNYKPKPPLPTNPRDRERVTTVCRHWLRNLCKLGEAACDYSHEYSLRLMPVCAFYMKRGKCELGGECLYDHPRGKDLRKPCPDYARGFCVLGPDCPRRHTRKVLCQAYAAGFCPDGPECKLAHPPTKRAPREDYINPVLPDPALAGPPPSLPAGYGRWREYRYDENAFVRPTAAWLEGGSLSGWRSGGVSSQGGGGGPGGPPGGGRRERDDGYDGGHGGERDRRGGGGGGGGWVKDLSGILCFRCNQHGHFANNCTNEALPGDRGGLRAKRQ